MKRIGLFLITNLAIVLILGIVLNIVFSVLGINSSSVGGLLALAIVFGFGGSFISLAMSKWIAKRSTGAVVITSASNETESWLLKTINQQAKKAGIVCPEIAIYNAPDMNAFATGMNKNKALVAVSTGLLEQMTREEAEAVLAHEISHIANGDMVTLALIQGVVNTFVIFIARIVAGFINNFLSSDDEGESSGYGFSYFIIVFILEMIFGILASTIVMYFSRRREFSADMGAAKLVGKDKMIAALQRLQKSAEPKLEGSLMAFGISGKRKGGLFMSHPPLEMRIKALKDTI